MKANIKIKSYMMVITNGERIEYKKVRSSRDLATTIKEENGLLNTAWKVKEENCFEITEAMENHFNLVKVYREAEAHMKEMFDAIYDKAQWLFSREILDKMEEELDAHKEIVKAAKREMNKSLHENNWSQSERRGMKKMFEGMMNITAGEL